MIVIGLQDLCCNALFLFIFELLLLICWLIFTLVNNFITLPTKPLVCLLLVLPMVSVLLYLKRMMRQQFSLVFCPALFTPHPYIWLRQTSFQSCNVHFNTVIIIALIWHNIGILMNTTHMFGGCTYFLIICLMCFRVVVSFKVNLNKNSVLKKRSDIIFILGCFIWFMLSDTYISVIWIY